ncbi:hypothetical protein GCM10027321_30920 [Massilia terrae]
MSGLAMLHLGDITLTLPVAAALAAWLLACRAWRGALCWGLLYAMAITLVGASKIAFLGWGTGIPALEFKAISGHATGATAVFPIVFFLLVREHGPVLRRAAVAAGLVLGALVAIMLVAGGHHTASEVAAGWATGAAVSLAAIRCTAAWPPGQPTFAIFCAACAFAGATLLIKSAPLGYWMARAALALSGSERLHSWYIHG